MLPVGGAAPRTLAPGGKKTLAPPLKTARAPAALALTSESICDGLILIDIYLCRSMEVMFTSALVS